MYRTFILKLELTENGLSYGKHTENFYLKKTERTQPMLRLIGVWTISDDFLSISNTFMYYW